MSLIALFMLFLLYSGQTLALKNMKSKTKLLTGFFLSFFLFTFLPAHAETGDLALEGIRPSQNVIAGENVRIYATVKNNSSFDLLGTVKFFDESAESFIGNDQPVSVLANETDTVFVDWKADSMGDKLITARVVPWDDDGDDGANNKITATIYVDIDSDGDGAPNRQDSDDDNDGVADVDDAFPLNANESIDADGDGVGDNSDEDDDNDGVPDVEDMFTTDPNETRDADGDGVGDNSDAFPNDFDEWEDQDGDGLGSNADPDDNNVGPIVQFNTGESKLVIKEPITFDASQSTDEDGQVAKFEWDFGEGFQEGQAQVEREFEVPGEYQVTVKVTDNKGEYRASEFTFKIADRVNIWWIVVGSLLGMAIVVGVVFYVLRRRVAKK